MAFPSLTVCDTQCSVSISNPLSLAVTHQQRLSLQGLADTKIPRSGARMSVRSSRSISVLRIPSQSQISRAYSSGSLHRSVSQLMDIQDKKVLIDDSLWETIMGHDSGLVSGCLVPGPLLNIQ